MRKHLCFDRWKFRGMFKIFLLLQLMLLLSCSYHGSKPDCKLFKEGKFLWRDNRSRTKFIIERKGGIQTELSESTDMITTFRVKWLSECEYELTGISAMPIKSAATDAGFVRCRDRLNIH